MGSALPAFLDARSVPEGTVLTPDLAIIGGGPAGISLALALARRRTSRCCCWKAAAWISRPTPRSSMTGTRGRRPLHPARRHTAALSGRLDQSLGRLVPAARRQTISRSATWVAHSGWPFSRKELEPYFPRAQATGRGRPVPLRRAGALCAGKLGADGDARARAASIRASSSSASGTATSSTCRRISANAMPPI